MVRCEPHVLCINIKKISKIKNISQFDLEQNIREREREREEGEKQASFSRDFTRFCLSELSRPRVKDVLRDKSYAWRTKITRFRQGPRLGFSWKSRKCGVPRNQAI